MPPCWKEYRGGWCSGDGAGGGGRAGDGSSCRESRALEMGHPSGCGFRTSKLMCIFHSPLERGSRTCVVNTVKYVQTFKSCCRPPFLRLPQAHCLLLFPLLLPLNHWLLFFLILVLTEWSCTLDDRANTKNVRYSTGFSGEAWTYINL